MVTHFCLELVGLPRIRVTYSSLRISPVSKNRGRLQFRQFNPTFESESRIELSSTLDLSSMHSSALRKYSSALTRSLLPARNFITLSTNSKASGR